jgi:hypothetical protein
VSLRGCSQNMPSTVAALVVPAHSVAGAQVLVLVMAIGLCTYASGRKQEGGDTRVDHRPSVDLRPPPPQRCARQADTLSRPTSPPHPLYDHVSAQHQHGCRQEVIRGRDPKPQSTNLLLDTPDEVAMAIACQLGSATDLLRLGMACKRFRVKPSTKIEPKCDRLRPAAVPSLRGELHPTTHTGLCSVMNEAGRRWLMGCSQEQQAWVPYRPRGSAHLPALERAAMQRIRGVIAAFLRSLQFLHSEFEDEDRHEALLQRNMAVRTGVGVQPHPGRFLTLLRAAVSQLEPHIAAMQACGMLADFAGGLFHVSSFKLSSLFSFNVLSLDRTLTTVAVVTDWMGSRHKCA